MELLAGRHIERARSRRAYRRVFVRVVVRFFASRFVALRRVSFALRPRLGGWVSNALVFSERLSGFPPPEVWGSPWPSWTKRTGVWVAPLFPAEAFACWYSASFPATRMVRRVRAYVNSQSGGAIRKHLATASGQIGAVHFWPPPASARFWPIMFQPRKWPCCMGQSLPRNDQSSVRASLFRA